MVLTVAQAVRGACQRGLLCQAQALHDHSSGFFFDLDDFEANLGALRAAFPEHWHHAIAIKTNPLAALMRLGLAAGHGIECASIGEVQHALRVGFQGPDIVYDSPCKTTPEIAFALDNGVHLNADNFEELARIKVLLDERQQKSRIQGDATASVIGLRINPLVGTGGVLLLSVSTRQSKFGVVVPSETGSPERHAVVEALATEFPFVSAVHVHVGSGSMKLEQAAQGAASAVQLALEVNEARTSVGAPSAVAARSGTGRDGDAGRSPVLIDVIDIGGGLPVGWGIDGNTPTWLEYANLLRTRAPELFDGTFRRVVTEFGASVFCKFGWLGSAVEVVKDGAGDGGDTTIAMIHAGSDLFLRACYAPHMRGAHPVSAYSADGSPKEKKAAARDKEVAHDIAGPLCFAGDVVAKGVLLPSRLEVGNVVVLHEAGGNTLALANSHCSRRHPPAYGYRSSSSSTTRIGPPAAVAGQGTAAEEELGHDAWGVDDGLHFTRLSKGTTIEQVLEAWSDD